MNVKDRLDMVNKEIAERIKTLMKNKGIKQKDIIEKLHTTKSSLSAKLGGKRMLTAEDIVEFSSMLECSTETLLKEKPPHLVEVTKDEEEFFKLYFSLSDENQKIIKKISNALAVQKNRKYP